MKKSVQNDNAIYGVAKLDPAGRLIVPVELRQYLGINYGDLIGVYVQDGVIFCRKICDNPQDDIVYTSVRRVDSLGRIALPAVFRRSLGIPDGAYLDVSGDVKTQTIKYQLHITAGDLMQHIVAAYTVNRMGYESDKTRPFSVAIEAHLNYIGTLIKEQAKQMALQASSDTDSRPAQNAAQM